VSSLSGSFLPALGSGNSTPNTIANFGQDSSFAGNKTAQGNQDGNSIGDFYYTPESGYLALCTSNLTAPAVKPQENFNTVLYAGNSTVTAHTGLGFQPDLCWFKRRSGLDSHLWYDVVRGNNKVLKCNNIGAEATDGTDTFKSFDTDGFTLGTRNELNHSSHTFVAWNWKAGGADVLNELGTIDSQVSANADAGFSIVSYNGNGLDNADSIGHGLSKKPELVISKDRTAYNWYVDYFENGTNTNHLELNGNSSGNTAWTPWGSASTTLLTSISSGGGGWWTNNTHDQISYCFHSVDGYSKVGSYIGNGLADGTFVYTGFRVKWLLTKQSTVTGDWTLHDAVRDIDNPLFNELVANTQGADHTSDADMDFTSNGFKIRRASGQFNTSGATIIYLAFAEYPFKYANAR
jgi:hypothetical protein